jgi:hypothetical protein
MQIDDAEISASVLYPFPHLKGFLVYLQASDHDLPFFKNALKSTFFLIFNVS